MPSKSKHEVIVQKWEESELGWGTRPDGYSLHMTDADREAFITEYWDGMPDEVQDEYTRPDGTSYKATVNAKVFKRVQASKKNGIRYYGKSPGDGGRDGWMSRA